MAISMHSKQVDMSTDKHWEIVPQPVIPSTTRFLYARLSSDCSPKPHHNAEVRNMMTDKNYAALTGQQSHLNTAELGSTLHPIRALPRSSRSLRPT